MDKLAHLIGVSFSPFLNFLGFEFFLSPESFSSQGFGEAGPLPQLEESTLL